MFRKIAITTAAALALSTGVALAAGGAKNVKDIDFSFEGPFGTYDEFQLQRGLQIYTESCMGCHGLKYVPIRSLSDEGGPSLPEDQVRAYAKQFSIVDKDTGEEREGKATDNFPANTGANAPDLSLMAKARAGFSGPVNTGINQLIKGVGGPEYIYSILTGYTGEEKTEAGTTFYANTAFPGGWIAMPPPLSDGQVTFSPEHGNSLQDLAQDAAAFLMWTAEPKMMDRKRAGFIGVALLVLLTTLLYLTNKRLWAGIKGKDHA